MPLTLAVSEAVIVGLGEQEFAIPLNFVTSGMLLAANQILVRDGMELGHAMDRLIDAHDTKHGAGAVGILTDGMVDRQGAYEVLVMYALAPFLTPTLYER